MPLKGPRLHTLRVQVFSNDDGVTTLERPDQGHLNPLGEPRDTCHSRGTNLRPPAMQVRTLPKELSRQLIAGYSEPLLGLRESATSSLHNTFIYLHFDASRPQFNIKTTVRPSVRPRARPPAGPSVRPSVHPSCRSLFIFCTVALLKGTQDWEFCLLRIWILCYFIVSSA